MNTNLSVAGFAICRNGTCKKALGEVDCGATVGVWTACCPHAAFCPSETAYNAYCCDVPNINCTMAILNEGPFCANTAWTMYDNAGYFCDAVMPGYQNTRSNSDGCARPGYQAASSENYLSPIGQKAKRECDAHYLTRLTFN